MTTGTLVRQETRRGLRFRLATALVAMFAIASLFTVADPAPDSAAASETRTRAEITRWYLYALGRSPDAGGHNFWTDYSQEIGAQTFAGAAYNIHLSQEFYNRHSNWQSRVTTLYQSVLARSPDANGLNFWVDELSSGNRTWAQVVAGFAYSQEAMNRFHAINAQDCGVEAVLPNSQLYDQHRSSMSGEALARRRAEADNRFGIVVMNAWIRGTQRQALTGSGWVVNGPTLFKIETKPDSDRGATRTFSPNDSRATLVMDHATGGAFISVHSTSFVLNIRFAPDFNLTTSAFSVSGLWGSVSPNWYSVDTPRYTREELAAAIDEPEAPKEDVADDVAPIESEPEFENPCTAVPQSVVGELAFGQAEELRVRGAEVLTEDEWASLNEVYAKYCGDEGDDEDCYTAELVGAMYPIHAAAVERLNKEGFLELG